MDVRVEVPQLLYSSRQTAKMLNISERTLFDERKRGKIHATRVAGSVKFDIDEIRAYCRRNREGTNGNNS